MPATCGKCKATGVDVAHVRKCYEQEPSTLYGERTYPMGQDPALFSSDNEEGSVAVKVRVPGRINNDLEDGIYALKEHVPDTELERVTYYMLYHTVHGANQLVGKKLVLGNHPDNNEFSADGTLGEWVYEGKAPLRVLTEDDRLTAEEAAHFGQIYGWCGRCGRTLTNEASKAAGIGPVCAGKE